MSKEFLVHHIHIKIGDGIYTFYHRGSCVDVVELLNRIAFLQDTELTKRIKK